MDRFSKYSIFVPCNSNIDAIQTAKLFVEHVFVYYGVPCNIVSDRGTQFMSIFWKEFMASIGIKLHHSTAYHPQTDGQTERVNQSLEQYLRCFSNAQQDNWASNIPIAQFSYNSTSHLSNGITPFKANLGYTPSFTPMREVQN